MDLAIDGRRFRLSGLSDSLAEACRAMLEAEGAVAAPSAGGDQSDVDIVVAGWPGVPGSSVLDVEHADQLHRAWDVVEASLAQYQVALATMESTGWGRFVWVGPASTKSLDSCEDDLGAVMSLAMLAVNKLVTSEAGAAGLTANAVLVGGSVTDHDVAAAVCFLCSHGAGYLSGISITVDGGAGSAMFA